jgi:hypothetical protein
MVLNLLVCISFHYSFEKFPYLINVLDNFLKNYPESKIIIDTNSTESKEKIFEFRSDSRFEVFVHQCLKHPFHLAWMHRKHIRKNLDNYDVFMYVEDDMLVPKENYLNYLHVFDLMWPNYIPSFVRTEEKDGILYCADSFVRTKINSYDIVEIRGRKFVTLDNPYHAFWIMPQKALKESVNDNFERIYDGKGWVREIAASYGLRPGSNKKTNWPSYDVQKKGLVEVDKKMQVSTLCHSKHLTNKYINDMAFDFGKIRLDRLIKREFKLL